MHICIINSIFQMANCHAIRRFPSLLYSVFSSLFLSVFFAGAQSVQAQEPIPDLQCVYAEAELREIFMDPNPNRYLDPETVTLLAESCPVPTPKAELIYLYIRSAVAIQRYDGSNPAALSEGVEYYRLIVARQHVLADIAQVDPSFVLEYRTQLAELARHVEADYIETFASNPVEMNSRGQADYGSYRGSQSITPEATYGISRGGQAVDPVLASRYARGNHAFVSAMEVQLTPGRSTATGYPVGDGTNWGATRGGAPASASVARSAAVNARQQPQPDPLTPKEVYNQQTRQALRSAEGRYAGFRQASDTYSRAR